MVEKNVLNVKNSSTLNNKKQAKLYGCILKLNYEYPKIV